MWNILILWLVEHDSGGLGKQGSMDEFWDAPMDYSIQGFFFLVMLIGHLFQITEMLVYWNTKEHVVKFMATENYWTHTPTGSVGIFSWITLSSQFSELRLQIAVYHLPSLHKEFQWSKHPFFFFFFRVLTTDFIV